MRRVISFYLDAYYSESVWIELLYKEGESPLLPIKDLFAGGGDDI